MRKSSWAAAAVSVVALCGGVGPPEPAKAQASFDCRRASHPSEVAVCRDPGLASADRDLDVVFRSALERSAQPDALRAEQRIWLSDLRNCGVEEQCLYEAYADRIEALEMGVAASGQPLDVEDAPTETPPSAGVSDDALPMAEEPSPALEVAPAQQEVVPAAVPPSDSRSGATEREDQRRPDQAAGVGELVGSGLILGLIVAILAALLATKALADHSMRKFGWPMILNWWNVLHLVVGFSLWCGAALGSPVGGFVVAGGVWLIVLAVNIRKTDVLTGVAMTIVQPFVVAILFVVFQLSRNKTKPYNYINRS